MRWHKQARHVPLRHERGKRTPWCWAASSKVIPAGQGRRQPAGSMRNQV
ncbi:hypothetical protein VITFI_CDS0885 [Vitreoscilla filiformis]|uniref:Uncharacterized protein n=1 Tax=Vitreoscilla filiformis TaxID=63 RepID=A0A221KCY0_VITFI|nr:hypothetical protein VITFI_CDS0885 [Vitreoscilla filiformis]